MTTLLHALLWFAAIVGGLAVIGFALIVLSTPFPRNEEEREDFE